MLKLYELPENILLDIENGSVITGMAKSREDSRI
jgi:hypothetical protein